MAHISLESYYKTNFGLMQHHKYSLTEIENLIPWERDIYVGLLNEYIEHYIESVSSSRRHVKLSARPLSIVFSYELACQKAEP